MLLNQSLWELLRAEWTVAHHSAGLCCSSSFHLTLTLLGRNESGAAVVSGVRVWRGQRELLTNLKATANNEYEFPGFV